MSATYIYVQTRRPTKDGSDPGQIEEGWFTVTDGAVRLCDREGKAIRGEESTARIKQGEAAKEVAVRLLRAKLARKPSRPFNRPLRYPALSY